MTHKFAATLYLPRIRDQSQNGKLIGEKSKWSRAIMVLVALLITGRSRFSASVLIRVVCAGAAAPSREVPFAVRLGVPTRAGDLGISVRHAAALSDLRSWRHWPPERAVCVSTSPLTK